MTWRSRFGAARVALAMLMAAAVLLAQPDTSRAVEFVVVTRFDAVPPIPGSLRDAILEANASPGPDVIRFDVEPPAGSTVVTIDLVAALPPITDTVTIDATTQLGYTGQPVVEVRGPPQPLVPGLSFQVGSSGSRVEGLSLTGFSEAIVLASDGNTVTGNWIGVGADTAVRANATGILVTGDQNVVGPANVVSGNSGTGVLIEGTPGDVSVGVPPDPAVANTVVGNIVGLPPSGTGGGGLFGNREGVVVTGPADSNRVGGTAAADRNVISANSIGVAIGTDDTSTANTVAGNFIGTDITGQQPLGNLTGVSVRGPGTSIGGAQAGAGNVISGNGEGIAAMFTSGLVIQGNRIGTDAAGTTALGNGGPGIGMEGDVATLIAGNVISDNAGAGIRATFSDGLVVEGNAVTGTVPGGVLSGVGIRLDSTNSARIGGTAAGLGNVISANQSAGVFLACPVETGIPPPTGTVIEGNRIGTDGAGLAALGNGASGILVFCGSGTRVGGTVAGAGNIISANAGSGISDTGTDERIQGNSIGVGADGRPLGNGGAGVFIGSTAPEIGGDTPEAGNEIAFNTGAGVAIANGTNNPIRLNSIHDNGGLGIDLGANGVVNANDPTDADTGPNDLQNYPEVFSATLENGVLTVAGTLQTEQGLYDLDFYANVAPDPSGFGEGQTYLGSITVGVDTPNPVPFTFTLPVTFDPGWITATATDSELDTSEFSNAVDVKAPLTLTTQASGSVAVGGPIFDTATLIGDVAAGSQVVFRLYGPNDDACATEIFSSTVLVSGPGQYTSDSFSTTAPGTYRWIAEYRENNEILATTPCDDPNEAVVVTQAVPTLTTQASATGTTVTDTATLSGGFNPTGTISFSLYGPDSAACAPPPLFSASVPVNGNGTYNAPPVNVTQPGTYRWVASYSGDANNAPVTGACNDPNESVVVTIPTTTTTTSTTSTTTTLPPGTTTTSSTTLPPATTTSTTTTLPPTTTTSSLPPPITTTTSTTTTSTTTTLPPTTTVPPTTTITTTTTTTTTLPPSGTTTTLAAVVVPTTAPVTGTTAPPTTGPTTTAAPPTTTTTIPPPTTAAPTTTTTAATVPPTVPPTGGSSVEAVTPDGDRTGPPGVALDLSGGGYTGCRNVYFFFDGVRIGTTSPDANGFVDADDLSVPGDTDPGEYTLTSSCSSSGGPVRASSTFSVTDADFHRAGVVTSLANPDQVSLELERLLASVAASGLVILLFAFPSKLFNGAVEENYDEIRAWFRRPARAVETASTAARTAGFFILNALAGVALGFLSPDFGLNMNSLVLATAFTLSLIVMSAGWSLPAAIGIHRRTGEWGKLNFLPGTLVVSIVMVFICRRLEIQPGYFYGALAGLAFASALNRESQGKLTAANWMWALAISLASWFFRLRVSEIAAEPDASVLWIGLEAFLVMTFLWGVETLAVAMLPMRFMDGPKVKAWNRWAWAALLFAGVFITVHVLLVPTSGYVGQTETEVALDVLVVFLVFCAISVATWAYFRYRPARWVPKPAR